MSERKEIDDYPSEEISSQAESFDANKSGTSETYDMKDFCPGIRIEAKDFDGKWYPAKVSDVDWTENEILVHFENWNTKFDEWIPMDSSRLRPIQKPVLQQKDVVKFSKGEEVMAMWSPYQKYPATIQAVLANDRYDVLFYDGFLKRLKFHKISKIEGGTVKKEVKNFTDIGTKEERRERKRKINVAELFHINKRSRKKGLVHSKSQDIKTYPVSKSRTKSSGLKKPLIPEETPEATTNLEVNEGKPLEDKTLPVNSLPTTKALIDTIPAAFEVKYLNGQTELWSKQLYQRSEGRTAGKLDIVILNPQGRKFRSRNEIMKYCEENNIVYSHEAFDFSARGRPKSKSVVQTLAAKPEMVLDDKEKASLKKGPKKVQQEVTVLTEGPPGVSAPQEILPQENVDQNKVFIGDFEVVIENGKFICPVKTCGKYFRRENLLHMHMKHYHPEFSKYLDYTPSVTDLAYARTVGSLDSVEVPSPAPRKLAVGEKTEKSSVKGESVRKTSETLPDIPKEPKKVKTFEGRSHPLKVPTNEPKPAAIVVEEAPEEVSMKTKPNLSNLQLGKSTVNLNENEVTPPESQEAPTENISNERTVVETPPPAHNVVKSIRHHRLHGRKKAGRFQGSFAEHMRKKRFISQGHPRSHNRTGRQQLLQQIQQPQPSQTTISSSSTEDANSNAPNHACAVARYPKPHLNISNEISGKNNLLTSCKNLSPAPKKKGKKKRHSESTKTLAKCSALKQTEESYSKFKENNILCESEKEINRTESVSRRSFLAGLLNARKRKGKAIRNGLREKKLKRKSLDPSSLVVKENEAGRGYHKEKPDDEKENNVSEEDLHGLIYKQNSLSVNHNHEVWKSDVGMFKRTRNEREKSANRKREIKLRIKSVNEDTFKDDVENYVDRSSSISFVPNVIKELTINQNDGSTTQKNEFSEAGDLINKNRGLLEMESIAVNNKAEFENEVNTEKKNTDDVGLCSPAEKEMKCDINLKNLPETCVLLENLCPKEIYNTFVLSTKKGNDEIKRCENYNSAIEKNQLKLSQKRNKGRKSNKDHKKKRKRVRFENDIMEKWINVDERKEFNSDSDNQVSTSAKVKEEIRRVERKKSLAEQQLVNYLKEKEMKEAQILVKTSKGDTGIDQAEGTEDSKSPLVLENDKVEKLRRNEIINCICGITEEDGLMIQCDLCLCWQHGHCAGILRELDVPEKYTCTICKNPYRARSSMKYLHDQEWLKEGTLPSLSFRSKREDIINQRRTILKRSHDLSGSIALLAQVVHSLRVKVNIAEKKDHPKLWLWAKKWTEKKPNRLKEESEIKEERPEEPNSEAGNGIKTEEGVSQDEKQLPKAPEPEAPIDSAECRLNLLDHLIHYQTLIDARLSCIESLVAELESMQDDAVNDETPERYPRTKATVQMLLRDLNTMRKIAAI